MLRKLSIRFALLILSVAASLLALEGVFRIAGVGRHEPKFDFGRQFRTGETAGWVHDDELFWKPPARWGNRLGVRGWVPSEAADENRYLVVCVGDSCTFGYGVHHEQSYGMRLEGRLRRRLPGARVETIVAALPGYSSHQNVAFWQKHLRPYRPDLTILYLGAWNDYAPAMKYTDGEYARETRLLAEHPFWSLRIGRVVRGALGPKGLSRAELRAGDRTFGNRVPLTHFRENVITLVRAARQKGSRVLGVIPPFPDWHKRRPLALRYRECVLRAYSELGVPVLDAQKVFDEIGRSHPPLVETKKRPDHDGWKPRYNALFLDSCHPTNLGYELIARALDHLLASQDDARLARLKELTPEPPVTLSAARPIGSETLEVGQVRRVLVEGSGFRSPSAFERIWLGGQWIRSFQVIDDRNLKLVLPREHVLRPGSHALELITRGGLARLPDAVTVAPPRLELTAVLDDGRVIGTVKLITKAREVRVVVADRKREVPLPTAHGPLWLVLDHPRDAPSFLPFPEGPRETHVTFVGAPDGDGRFERSFDIEVPATGTRGPLYAQALLMWSGRMEPVATTLAEATLP